MPLGNEHSTALPNEVCFERIGKDDEQPHAVRGEQEPDRKAYLEKGTNGGLRSALPMRAQSS